MSVYYLPALFGLATKLFILMFAVRREKVSTSFISLILIFACHNAIELIGYVRFLDDQAVSALFRSYYAATIIMLMLLTMHVQNISGIFIKGSTPILVTCAGILVVLVVATNSIIAGDYSIGYALTAIKGPYFSVFAVFALTCLVSVFALLAFGYHQSKDELKAAQCLYSLYSLSPLIFCCLLVLVLKLMSVGMNAAGILPIATTLFLFMMLKSEGKHQLTDLRRLLPFSIERRSAAEFLRLTDSYAQNANKPGSFADLRDGLERQAILYTLEKCENNVSKAAEMMGLQNRSTLYSMMKRLEISPSERIRP